VVASYQQALQPDVLCTPLTQHPDRGRRLRLTGVAAASCLAGALGVLR
jgi:hypothetical protein